MRWWVALRAGVLACWRAGVLACPRVCEPSARVLACRPRALDTRSEH